MNIRRKKQRKIRKLAAELERRDQERMAKFMTYPIACSYMNYASIGRRLCAPQPLPGEKSLEEVIDAENKETRAFLLWSHFHDTEHLAKGWIELSKEMAKSHGLARSRVLKTMRRRRPMIYPRQYKALMVKLGVWKTPCPIKEQTLSLSRAAIEEEMARFKRPCPPMEPPLPGTVGHVFYLRFRESLKGETTSPGEPA